MERPCQGMAEVNSKQFRQLQKQIRDAKVGGTNAATLQLLANMCREESSIIDYQTYKAKKEGKKEDQSSIESFWRRRFLRSAPERKVAVAATTEDDPEVNLFSKYVKQKCEKDNGKDDGVKATLSENVQDMLFKMTYQFGTSINEAYKSDPAAEGPAAELSRAATLQQMDQIDQNMAAIDEDMNALDAKHGDFAAAMKHMLGVGKLGTDDYLENESDESDESSTGSESMDSSSDDDDSEGNHLDEESDGDSGEDSSWDEDESDDSSIDSAFMACLANDIGINMPEEDDDSVDTTYVKAVASGKLAPSTMPVKLSQPAAQTVPSVPNNEPEMCEGESTGSESKSCMSDEADSGSDSDGSLDEDFLNGFAATLDRPPPANCWPAIPVTPIAATAGHAEPQAEPVRIPRRSVSMPGKAPYESGASPKAPARFVEGCRTAVGWNVGCFDATGRPNNRASKLRRSLLASSEEESEAQASDLGIAAKLKAECDENFGIRPSPSSPEPLSPEAKVRKMARRNTNKPPRRRTMVISCNEFAPFMLVTLEDFTDLQDSFEIMKEEFTSSIHSIPIQDFSNSVSSVPPFSDSASSMKLAPPQFDCLPDASTAATSSTGDDEPDAVDEPKIDCPPDSATTGTDDDELEIDSNTVQEGRALLVNWGDTGAYSDSDSDADDDKPEEIVAVVSSWKPRGASMPESVKTCSSENPLDLSISCGGSEKDAPLVSSWKSPHRTSMTESVEPPISGSMLELSDICEMQLSKDGDVSLKKPKKSCRRKSSMKRASWSRRVSFRNAFQDAKTESNGSSSPDDNNAEKEVQFVFPTIDFKASKKKKHRRKKNDEDSLSTRRRRKIRHSQEILKLKEQEDYFKGLSVLDRGQARTINCTINGR